MRMPIHRMRRHVTAMRGGFKPAARNFSRNLQRHICVHRLASESAEKIVSGSFRSGIQRVAVTSPSRYGLAIGTEDYVSVPKPAQLSGTRPGDTGGNNRQTTMSHPYFLDEHGC
jgi:hypothetical protein